jgi:hypothetical protein
VTTTDTHISELRDIVLRLSPTGPDGFEGLLAAVLSEIAKTPFALAQSGSQGGKDGASALDAGAISFEGKLYTDGVPKNEVITKIAEVGARDEGGSDLWILGSTGTVSTQISETVAKIGEGANIGTLILDWSSTGLPLLATLLAMATDVSAKFLATKTGASEADVLERLGAVRLHGQFIDQSSQLAVKIDQPSIGPAYALKQNAAWLSGAFGDERTARTAFGQRLAPGDKNIAGILDRVALRQKLAANIFSKPDGAVTAILGADGNGKSWIFAQAWMNQAARPLTLVLVPEDVALPLSLDSLEDLLISKLIAQTGDTPSEVTKRRWRKHLNRWRRLKDAQQPRLVVFMDGINQRESLPWVKFLNGMGDLVGKLGGKFVFSSRTPFYASTEKKRLLDQLRPIEVPEWSNPELDTLLKDRGTSISKLSPKVVVSLRNPRIFAVAAELFETHKIEQFGELSISRLLFEHIRIGTSPTETTPKAFVRGVRDHADEIIKRLKEKSTADLKVFDRKAGGDVKSLGSQFAVISDGLFFEEMPDDELYVLKDEGMPLALGLSILSTARRAHRNDLDLAAELAKILDPIAALDITADVLLSALIAAVLEDDTPEDTISALVASYVGLQNLDQSRYEEFRSLLRMAPSAFLKALETVTLSTGVTSNLDWLTEALKESRHEASTKTAIASFVRRWLSMYSLAPERLIHLSFTATKEEVAKEREKRQAEIDTKVAALGPFEKNILDSLIREDRGDYSHLSKIAFHLLAATPLADLGESFRNFAFTASLNGGFYDGHDEFNHLVQFNRVDWIKTRTAILEAAAPLRQAGVSTIGQWALVALLHATASSQDAQEANAVAKELTKDREHFRGWRLIENWCATDPCDPNSERPDNIDKAATDYLNLNVSELRSAMGNSRGDMFFDDARAGLARFEPDALVATMRRFAADMLKRPNESFRFAAFLMENHTAALEDKSATDFVSKAYSTADDALKTEDKHKELFVASQYSLAIAFPHMNGDEQLEVVVSYPRVGNVLLSVCDLMGSADEQKFEAALEVAYAADDSIVLFRLMAFAEYGGTPITQRAKEIVGHLAESSEGLVRLCALGVVRRLGDLELLRRVVDSDWSAAKLDASNARFEIAVGSDVLILAAEKGIVSIEDCFDRISLSGYGNFVQRLGKGAALLVAQRIDVALTKAAGHEVSAILPDIEQNKACGESARPELLDVTEKRDPNENAHDSFKRLSETGDAWHARHERNQDAVRKFEEELTQAGAGLVLYHLGAPLIQMIYDYDELSVERWLNRLTDFTEGELKRVYNFGMVVAQVIGKTEQKAAAVLFGRLREIEPYVRITFGRSRVGLDAVSLWRAGEGDEIKALRFKRLDEARNDFEIANEVLAAIVANRQAQIEEYVRDRHERVEPAHLARAIMVAAFSEESDWALEIIESHKADHGFLASAHSAAKYAMDRHRWSRHWARKMRDAQTATELWRYAVLLSVIVDGRFHGSEVEGEDRLGLCARYGLTFNDLIRRRIDKWKDKRQKKLFGMDVPDDAFLR